MTGTGSVKKIDNANQYENIASPNLSNFVHLFVLHLTPGRPQETCARAGANGVQNSAVSKLALGFGPYAEKLASKIGEVI